MTVLETPYDKYEPVIGLEVHVQLLTDSKAYSSDPTTYGAAPNTNVHPISLGHPGTLPMANTNTVEFAVRLGLAVGADIRERNEYARKNYFYADLPKGYQITQDDTPICTGGGINIKDAEGNPKTIHLTRIHMEEDSGKSIHDIDPFNTLIDLNRAGVPLLEIVSEPEIANAQEAYNYLMEVRKLVRYLEICDGNMEEGSMRCDANVSVRLKGTTKLGTRNEIKNINSMRNVMRAIESEMKRQIDVLEAGGVIDQETRGFDAVSGSSTVMRSKEEAHDYRYFTEPDLAPVLVKEDYIARVKSELPPLPDELFKRYTEEFGLSEYDAQILTENKEIALYFAEMTHHTKNHKAAANWMMGAIKSYLNEKAVDIGKFPIAPKAIAEIIELIDSEVISNSMAGQKLFPALLEQPGASPKALAEANGWIQEQDDDALVAWAKEAISMYPDKVEEYRNGKKGLIGLFMGEVMKMSRGKADPKKASAIIREQLEA